MEVRVQKKRDSLTYPVYNPKSWENRRRRRRWKCGQSGWVGVLSHLSVLRTEAGTGSGLSGCMNDVSKEILGHKE